MSVKAVAKNVRISPRKVGVVAGLVRGRSVEDAVTILNHTPRRASIAVKKVVESARANAENNHDYRVEGLVITQIIVTPGRRLKRYRPAAHGRALPYQKKSSHITVLVDGDKRSSKKAKTIEEPAENSKPKTVKKPATKKATTKKESK